MGLQFTPKSEEQLALDRCVPEGEYDFEILKAENEVSGPQSKNPGTPMIRITLGIYDSQGKMRTIIDRVMSSFEHKLRHFCDTTGLLPQYQSGSLDANHCTGRSGRCKLVIKEDTTGKYPPKNEVKDYCLRKAKPITAQVPQTVIRPEDDDVPF